jgi:Spy/CpxP family protein refolding chaperone
MSMNKPWQVCLILFAIFAAGIVSGGLVAFRVARRNAPHFPAPEVWVARRFDQLNRELNLTPQQKERVAPIVKRGTEELVKWHRQSLRASREVLERMEKDIAAELTPEQRTKFEQYLNARRERIRRLMSEQRGPRGERDRPPGEMPPPPPDAGGPPPSSPNPGDKPTGT